MNPTSPATPSVEPARPAWEAALAAYLYRDQSPLSPFRLDELSAIIARFAPAAPTSHQSPAPAQPVTATRELVDCLFKVGDPVEARRDQWSEWQTGFFFLAYVSELKWPYLVKGDLAAPDYSSPIRAHGEIRAAHEATRSLVAGQSGGVK